MSNNTTYELLPFDHSMLKVNISNLGYMLPVEFESGVISRGQSSVSYKVVSKVEEIV